MHVSCLVVAHVLGLTAGLRSEVTDLTKPTSGENRSAFQFSIINNASVPLNFLAFPKLARIYAQTQNRVEPGGKFSFLAALGAYDLHVTIHDGQSDWYQASETTWGLTKEGLSFSIFSSGCRRLAGDGYKSWWKSKGGRCAVPRSPF